MKAKILSAATLVSLLVFSLSACGGSSGAAPAAESSETDDVSDVSEELSAGEETTEEEISEEEVTEYYEEMPEETEEAPAPEPRPFHTFQTAFSEGRAWVEYYPTEEDYNYNSCRFGLIDESGYVYLTTDAPGTPMSGGYTVVSREDGFDIYNAAGVCSFSFTNTPELQMTVVGQGDGVFLVVEHATGFAGNAYYLYEIDGSGSEVSSRYEVASRHSYDPDPDQRRFTYLGSGIFACNEAKFYVNNGVLVDINELNIFSIALETPFVDGVSVAKKTETVVNGPFDTICTISAEDLQSAEAVEAWFNNSSSFGFYYDAAISGEGYMLHRIDPWGWEGNDGYYGVYDYRGNRLALMPSYPSEVSIIEMGTYKNGYAPLLLRGADQFYYVTMLDTNGVQQYDPICLGKNLTGSTKMVEPELRSFAAYAGGDFIYKQYGFTGEDGFIRIDVAGQSTFFEQLPSGSNLYAADENYVYFNDGCLTAHDGSIVFDSVFVTENEDSEPEDVPDEQTRNYISVSDYTIEGKWKSVGDYGFGQAQPGAIVVFDGTHCNVLSPEDTYAFYKQDEDFVLDCTSVLSGTESFVVKIVDEDNIDLHNGGYVTELTRVE